MEEERASASLNTCREEAEIELQEHRNETTVKNGVKTMKKVVNVCKGLCSTKFASANNKHSLAAKEGRGIGKNH